MRTRLLLLLILPFLLSACTADPPPPKDAAPAGQPPEIDVYIAETDTILRMDVETYVAGVVAGEMPADWPLEALKAQAILARTYTVKFLSEKESRYPGADISTDIAEAQAYDASAVDEHVLAAVQATSGEILMSADGTLPYTWFHSHSGGTTALAREALDWQRDEPSHTRVARGLDSDAAPPGVQRWTAEFTDAAFLAACRDAGYPVRSCRSVTIAETGPSGRAVTLNVDGTVINAARLRISLGSTKMRSTLLTELTAENGLIRMAGRGYGHGVGMPQWGAYALAEDGWLAEDIALHYYSGLKIVRAW